MILHVNTTLFNNSARPVKHTIVNISQCVEGITICITNASITRPLIKCKTTGVHDHIGEYGGKPMILAVDIYVSGHLLLQYTSILMFGIAARKILPGEVAGSEVDQHISDGLDIVPPRLLKALMGIDRSIAYCTSKIILGERDVVTFLISPIPNGEAEVDGMDCLRRGTGSNEKVGWLDIAMYVVVCVNMVKT